MPSDFGDHAVFHHINAVGLHDIFKAVRDHKDRLGLRELADDLQDDRLALGVNIPGRLIEDQDLCIHEEHSGERQTLGLPAG